MATQSKEPMEALKCKTCGAPLTVSPDDVVITCNFCGFTSTIEGEKIENHFVLPPSVDAADVRDKVTKWVGRGGKARVTESILRFVPFWVESMHAITNFEGYKEHRETEYYTDSQGNRRSRTKIEYEPIRGTFDENVSYNILARRGATFYSQDELDKALQITKQNIKPFNFSDITAVESSPLFLNAEITDHDSYEVAETMVKENHRQRADSKATKIWDCNSVVHKTGSYLLHIPHWLVRYDFAGETYRVGIDGYTQKVLKGEVPISGTFRGMMCAFSIIGLLIGVIGTHFVYLLLLPQGLEVLSFAMVIVGLIIAVFGTIQRFKITSEKRE